MFLTFGLFPVSWQKCGQSFLQNKPHKDVPTGEQVSKRELPTASGEDWWKVAKYLPMSTAERIWGWGWEVQTSMAWGSTLCQTPLPICWQILKRNHSGKTEEEDVWDMVAPEEVGFLHYSRNGSRNADNSQEMDDDQDVRWDITHWRDALKTVLLWKQKHGHKNTYLILIFLYFGCRQVLEKTSQSLYPYLCPSHCLSANECDLKAVCNSSSYLY